MSRLYYCKSDNTYHHKSELPRSLQPFVDYLFSSGGIAGDDFKSFNIKFKHAIAKALPDGYDIYEWIKGHYECSAVIIAPHNKFVYLRVPDVRFWQNEWFTKILIRTMQHPKDWSGGVNRLTSFFTLSNDILNLWRYEK